MLSVLLSTKRRREQGLRAGLARLAAEDGALAARQRTVRERRRVVQSAWREAGARSGCFDAAGLEQLRGGLARMHRECQALQRQWDSLGAERLALARTRDEQESLLRTILRAQEKLLLLQESME